MPKLFCVIACDKDGHWLTTGTFERRSDALEVYEKHPEEAATKVVVGQLQVQKQRTFAPAEAAAPPAKAGHAKPEHAKVDQAEVPHAKAKASHKHK